MVAGTRVYSSVSAKGDFDKADRLVRAFAALAGLALPLTVAAAKAAEEVSAKAFEREEEPTGRRWAALAPSTLRGRPPGKKLAGLLPARVWQILGPGHFQVRSSKDYDEYHTTGTRKMPARPDLPVMPGGMLVYGAAIHKALLRRIVENFREFGVGQ